MNSIATPSQMASVLAPWFPTFSLLLCSAESSVLQANSTLGLARPIERAGDFHRAIRNQFIAWCDETRGMFRMVQEREGLGLDCVVCNLIEGKPFVIRFGRLNGETVRRNSSGRENNARAHGVLSSGFIFPEMEDEDGASELPQVSLVYTIEDEGTRGGVPSWFMGEIVLGVERFDGFDRLAIVDKFSRPASIVEDVRRAVARPRADELAAWRRQIREAQRKHG